MTLVEGTFAPGKGFVAPLSVGIFDDVGGTGRADIGLGCVPCGSPYLLFLGRIHPIKQLELLFDAFIATTNEATLAHWNFVIGGEGEAGYVASLRRRIGRTVGGNRIHFCGWLTGRAKAKALSGAALFALTSLHENFGRSAAEAMLAGVPVVVSEEVFLADLIREHEAGWVVESEMTSLGHALRDAMLSPERRNRKALAARQLATSRFAIHSATREIVEKYTSILGLQTRVRRH